MLQKASREHDMWGLGTFVREDEVSPDERMTRVGWVNKGWEQAAQAGAEHTPKD